MENTVISLSSPVHYNNLFEFLSKHKAKDDKTGSVLLIQEFQMSH